MRKLCKEPFKIVTSKCERVNNPQTVRRAVFHLRDNCSTCSEVKDSPKFCGNNWIFQILRLDPKIFSRRVAEYSDKYNHLGSFVACVY